VYSDSVVLIDLTDLLQTHNAVKTEPFKLKLVSPMLRI